MLKKLSSRLFHKYAIKQDALANKKDTELYAENKSTTYTSFFNVWSQEKDPEQKVERVALWVLWWGCFSSYFCWPIAFKFSTMINYFCDLKREVP